MGFECSKVFFHWFIHSVIHLFSQADDILIFRFKCTVCFVQSTFSHNIRMWRAQRRRQPNSNQIDSLIDLYAIAYCISYIECSVYGYLYINRFYIECYNWFPKKYQIEIHQRHCSLLRHMNNKFVNKILSQIINNLRKGNKFFENNMFIYVLLWGKSWFNKSNK